MSPGLGWGRAEPRAPGAARGSGRARRWVAPSPGMVGTLSEVSTQKMPAAPALLSGTIRAMGRKLGSKKYGVCASLTLTCHGPPWSPRTASRGARPAPQVPPSQRNPAPSLKSGVSPRSGAPGAASGWIWVPSTSRRPTPGAEEVTSECQLRNPLGWQRPGRGGGGSGWVFWSGFALRRLLGCISRARSRGSPPAAIP